jgi:hypothetical protein
MAIMTAGMGQMRITVLTPVISFPKLVRKEHSNALSMVAVSMNIGNVMVTRTAMMAKMS